MAITNVSINGQSQSQAKNYIGPLHKDLAKITKENPGIFKGLREAIKRGDTIDMSNGIPMLKAMGVPSGTLDKLIYLRPLDPREKKVVLDIINKFEKKLENTRKS